MSTAPSHKVKKNWTRPSVMEEPTKIEVGYEEFCELAISNRRLERIEDKTGRQGFRDLETGQTYFMATA